MICLTGDVHHMAMRTLDQKRLAGSEAWAALRYAEIAAAEGLKVTFFATGRAVIDETSTFLKIARIADLELGGHGFRGRKPRWLYDGAFRGLLGRANGPRPFQAREIARTVDAFRECLGLKVRAWRDHAYRHDTNTYRLLASAGIGVVSDELAGEEAEPCYASGLVSLPINVWPDHDCLAHGEYAGGVPRSTAAAAPRFPARYLTAGEWLTAVLGQVDRIEARSGVATLLVHPACMGVLDDLATFASLCAALAGRRSVTATEAAAAWAAGSPVG